MPFTETGAEKVKRKAYEKGNRERGIEQEAKRDYKMFGTTQQNIPQVNPMGDVTMPMSAGMKKGGSVKKPTMTYETYTDSGKPAGMKTVKMAKGGSASVRADGCAIRGKTKA
jgi:hypothetical protein